MYSKDLIRLTKNSNIFKWSFCYLVLQSIFIVNVRADPIKVYMYHRQPPFVLESENPYSGLIFEVVELLNKFNAQKEIKFKVNIRPRGRLNQELGAWISGKCSSTTDQCDSNWVVFWVTPLWGWGEKAEERFLWVDLFKDQDLIISNANKPIEYNSPKDLEGNTFAAMLSHKYPPFLEEMMNSGTLTRQDGNNEKAVLLRVAYGNTDVTLLQKSTLDYFLTNDAEVQKIKKNLFVAKIPLKSFVLQVMLPIDRQDLKEYLNQMRKSGSWQQLLIKYQIKLD